MFYLRLFSKQAGNQCSSQACSSILKAVGGDYESQERLSLIALLSGTGSLPWDHGLVLIFYFGKRS